MYQTTPKEKCSASTSSNPQSSQPGAQVNPTLPEAISSNVIIMTADHIQGMINNFVASAFTSTGINDQYSPAFLSTLISPSSDLSPSISTSTWFLDSRTSNHMTYVEQHLCDRQTIQKNEQTKAANPTIVYFR